MAISRQEKVTILDVLTNNVATQKSVLFLTTKNSEAVVDAQVNQKLRMEARKRGLMIQLVKNSLLQRVFPSLPPLSGQTYVAYMFDGSKTDEVSVAKGIVELISADFKLHFDYIGSIVVGEYFDKEKTIQLSKIPTKEQSMGQLAGALKQIMTRIAVGIKEVPSSLARGISEYSKTIK